MAFFEEYSSLTVILSGSILGLIAVSVFCAALRRYEIAIALMLTSLWVHWVFSSNAPKGMEEMAQTGLATYIRISIVALMGGVGICQCIRLRSISREKLPLHLVLMGVFLSYALLSITYSLDRSSTGIRSTEFVLFFGFLLGVHYWINDRTRLDRALRVYFVLMICGVLINVAALVLLPGRAWYYKSPDRLVGLFTQPNSLGAFCMVSYPILMWKYSRLNSAGKGCIVLLFCLVAAAHVLSGSRSSLITAFLSLCLWVLVRNGRANLGSSVKILTLVVIVLFSGLIVLRSKPSSFTRKDSSITNLTGRPQIWAAAIQVAKDRPILGHGYGVGGEIWNHPRFWHEGQWWAENPRYSLHNGYLSVVIGLGTVGLLLLLIAIAIPIWRVMFLGASSYKALVVVIIFQGLLLNFFESAISSGSQETRSMVFWLFLVVAGRLPSVLPLRQSNRVRVVGASATVRRGHAA